MQALVLVLGVLMNPMCPVWWNFFRVLDLEPGHVVAKASGNVREREFNWMGSTQQ